MKPLLKWTGGKFDEYDDFSQYIPKFDRYFEPFFGGGGVFFRLNPEKAFVNDKSTALISFYNSVKNKKFGAQLDLVQEIWDSSKSFIEKNKKALSSFFAYENNSDKCELRSSMDEVVFKSVEKSLFSKKKRLLAIQKKEGMKFNEEQMNDHIETAVKSGIYMFFRSIVNKKSNKGKSQLFLDAVWFFVREFCYASMFRFNKNGDFNIPYGGTSYNKKDIGRKINEIKSKQAYDLISKTDFSNLDFDDFFKKFDFKKTDFIFLDPPYDSEFSEYDNNSFGKNDQIRLANTVLKLKAKWMMVIKDTPLIRSLYEKKGIVIKEFDKKYAYEVRGRNSENKDVNHLIIMNY